ncbi:hypothetical protein L3Q82_013682 [Scortum barcoo]|uniref:Uncharacterized protein n=1 Tax=Scortum barcoo TaxID=214431 RepID=A0ACB8W151_9TELE|nr:hypothetical protein L3Q82_013682 [Scortum barcoo]
MSGADGPNGTAVSPVPDYEWKYEYYEDEEPVSFEGLSVHHYSIAICFWVGLAVFVIFMFFLLTLLSKTGAPHPDSGQSCEKPHLIGYVDTNLSRGAPPHHPGGLDSPCSLFQSSVSKAGQVESRALCTANSGVDGGAWGGCHRGPSSSLEIGDGSLLQEQAATTHRMEKEAILMANLNTPNCVNSEQSSPVEGGVLLLEEPELPIISDGRDQTSRTHNDHNHFT